ncbi:MAG: hypothetical protein K0V04_10270, partial [Deltaproteobacteria bacterium]|nr:hypothetical protein [Deltaproteobacteria bacterium]
TNEQIIRLNTGDGFLPPHVSAGPGVHSNDELNAVRVADFNEDGREDVLVLSMALSGHAQLWLSNGKTLYREDQFDTGIPLDPHLDTSPLHPQAYPGMPQWQGETRFKSVNVMDSNADGILELAVISVEDAVNCSGHYVRQLSQDQSREGVFADRLVKVTDPLGVVEQVSYASLAQAATPCQTTTMGDDDQPLPTLVRCARRGVVVDERQIDHGTDPPRVLEYHYEGARNDIRGRGWLGFAAVQEHDVTAHRKTTYRYHQSALPLGFTCNPGWNCDWTYAYPGLGTPAEVEVVVENDAGTAVLATDTTTYTRTSKLIDLDSARYRTRLEAISRVEDHTGLPGGQVRTSATIFEDFDALDYPRYEVSSGDGGGMLKIERVYQPHDQSEALLGLVATETRTYTRQGTPNVVTTSSRSYDTLGKLEELVLEPQSTDPEIYLRKQFSYRPGHLLERAEEFDLNSSSSRSLELGWNSDGTFVASRTNGLAESTLFEHHLGFGSLYRVTDANGLMQTTDIDSFGRPLVVTDADGGTRTYSYTHIDAARPYAIAAAGSDNSWSQQQLDPLLRPVRVGATGPDGVDLWESIDYDELGRVHARSLPWNAQTPQPPPQSVFGYDELGRPQTTVFADNSTETVQYVGFDQRIVVDAVGNETVVHLDADGLAVQVDERTAASGVVRSHSYDHDARGRVISMADGTPGGEFSATYDVRGRRTDVQEPDTGGKHSQFNAFGQLVYSERSSFESGDVVEWTTYDRDAVGRVEALIHHGLSGKSFASRFEYGSGGVDVGRLVAMSRDNDGDDVEDVSTVIGYDSLGHIESRVTQIDGEQYVLSYTYDAEGRLLTSTYPKADGLSPVVRYHYNQWGALETILDDSPTASYGSVLWKAVDYDHGRLALSLKGSAQLVERTYDPLTRRLDSVTTEVAGTPIYAKDFGYYANGQLQSIDDTVMGVTETMTYDALGRLDTWDRAHVTSSFVREFDYDDDRSGVLAGVTDRDSGSTVLREVTYSFEAASPHAVSTTSNLDLLTMTDTQTFAEYDGLGRAIGETRDGELIRDVMEMNGFGLPMLVKSKDGEVTFRYDAQGRRVSRENSALGSRAHYVDDVYEHHVTSSPVEERHVYYIDSPEGRIGRWVFDSTKEEFELEYFDNDLRGSVELRTDSGGNVLDRRFYSPFGLDVDVSGNDLPMKDGAGFATHAGMADLELLDMKARLFNPRTRRFESTDPIFLGLDTYAYTHNDPINRVDLDGRWDELGSSCRDCWTHGWYSSGSGDQVGGGGIWDQPRAGNGNGGSGRAARKPRPPRPVIAAPSSAPDPGGHGSSGGEYVCDQSIESCGAGSGEAPSTSTSTSSSPSPSPSPTPEESEVQRRITELQEQHQQSLTVDELILNWYSGPPSEASETVDVAAPGPRTAFPVNGNYYGALTGAMLGVRAGKSRLGKVISGLTGGPRSAYRPTWMTQMYAWGIVFDALVIGPSDIPRGDMEHELSNSQYWADRAACAAGDCAGMAFAPLDPDTAHHWQDYNSRICWLPGCAPTP